MSPPRIRLLCLSAVLTCSLALLLTCLAASAQTQATLRIAEFQVALDRQYFSPGCIDNRAGPQTGAALRAWQAANGLPVTGTFDDASAAKLKLSVLPFSRYKITAADVAEVGTAPEDWRARAAQERMPYETLLELVAERCHTSQRFLRELNPQIAWEKVEVPAAVLVPNVISDDAPPQAAQVRINLTQKWLVVYDGKGKLCAFFPCSIGRDKMKRPTGDLQIVAVAPHPNYTFDPKVFPESAAAQAIGSKLIIPPGPNNPVGSLWLSIGRPAASTEPPLAGYGIHGTPKPEEIGRTESHGCFRLANWNVERLGQMISVGTPVIVEGQ